MDVPEQRDDEASSANIPPCDTASKSKHRTTKVTQSVNKTHKRDKVRTKCPQSGNLRENGEKSGFPSYGENARFLSFPPLSRALFAFFPGPLCRRGPGARIWTAGATLQVQTTSDRGEEGGALPPLPSSPTDSPLHMQRSQVQGDTDASTAGGRKRESTSIPSTPPFSLYGVGRRDSSQSGASKLGMVSWVAPKPNAPASQPATQPANAPELGRA